MNEEETKRQKEKETEQSTEQGTEDNSDKGDKLKTPQPIIDALAAAKRLEEANAEHKKLLDRQTDMISNKILAGTAGGHVESKQVSEVQQKVNQATEFFKDTALGDAIKKVNE